MKGPWIVLVGAAACAAPPPRGPRAVTAPPGAEIELVESTPIETTLDNLDVRDAADVWPEMIGRARRSVDVAELYASDAEDERESRLGPTVRAIEQAVRRGVRVRLLADGGFSQKYPATLERLGKAGVDVRTIDCSARYGGVQHAKYFVIDGEEAFVGSQNFDWRALAHIHEIGARVRSREIAGALLDVFETDWALAEPASSAEARARAHPAAPEVTGRAGEALALYASPKGWLPDESRWELPRIVSLLDGAARSISLQVLEYTIVNRDKSAFTTLDAAIRRAASRGVRVRLLVSEWGAKPGSDARSSVDALAALPNVEVRVLTIPPWSGGEIPFARVAHAKYLVVDGRAAWIGTSNWQGDYFFRSRNVSLVVEGGPVVARLGRVFDDAWSSRYAARARR